MNRFMKIKRKVKYMNKLNINILILIAVFITLISGCASTRNLLKTGDYVKETTPHSRTAFRQIWAVDDDGMFRVSGNLRLKGRVHANVPNYVEVTLVDTAGAVIEKQKVLYYPRILTGRKGRVEAKFTARFSKVPPRGTTIMISNVN